ncbi:hypothetical protein [Rubripirellula lacrimiformis]|uniref:hypothetical protein n=1 Tax=Rubripirellula lacrimiformis TaxID=1930273 RepID=UPI001C54C1CE|nr:hypothetical protein [Rubripirellula lacrimiformis]
MTTLPETNPYAPPSTKCSTSVKSRSRGTALLTTVAAACAIAFGWFTVILLRSGGDDHTGGMMFAANIPVVLAVVLTSAVSLRLCRDSAMIAAGVQLMITAAMLVMSIGDAWPVIIINSLVILPCIGIAAWARRLNRARQQSILSPQDIH